MSERKEKFTPGPWEAHGTSQQDFVTTAWEAKGGPDSPPTPENICKCGNDNGFYNAALIAAAPEMYEVLERAYTALWSDGYMYNKSQKLRADISTVLAKARGE